MYRKPDWTVEGRDWPNRSASRFVEAGGLRWHVQVMGAGPPILLLHGAGAATHSWRALAPLLAQTFTVIAPDLPGHGFTATPESASGLSLPDMAEAVGALVRVLESPPRFIIGHSAGAAIALRMTLDDRSRPKALVSINGALLPFPGLAAHVFPPAARLLFLNPLAVRLFAKRAEDRSRVERLMRSTGSRIDADGVDQYARLFRTTGHVAGVLGMMANWDLMTLRRDLPRLAVPLAMLVGAEDRAIAPETATAVKALLPGAAVHPLAGLGHLAHEESPNRVAGVLLDVLADHGG
jgi:magnesium chelatase accessory protein